MYVICVVYTDKYNTSIITQSIYKSIIPNSQIPKYSESQSSASKVHIIPNPESKNLQNPKSQIHRIQNPKSPKPQNSKYGF